MIFEKNISVLKLTDPQLANAVLSTGPGPDLEIVSAKNNAPSLKVSNISLHSLYDPVMEAKTWAKHYAGEVHKASSVCVLGFGLGYHLLELCRITEKKVTVFEPRLDILKTALETVDLTSILPQIKIVTGSKVPSIRNGIAVLQHKPSVNLNRDYFDNVLAGLRAREKLNQGLRILVAGPIYGGSLPVARYCSSALRKMGHHVELIDNSRFNDMFFLAKDIASNRQRYNSLMDILTSFASEVLMSRCEAFQPDIVLALAQAPLTPGCIEQLRMQKVTTAYWFVEDFMLMDYWKRIAGHYDFFFTIQKDKFFMELERAGIKNFYYLPMAAYPEIHQPVQLSEEEIKYYGSDVSFVGAGYYNRRHFLMGLLDFDLKIWGTDWDMNSPLAARVQRSGERIETDEIVKIFNATRININLHSSTYHKGVNPFGDFVNPRTFEIISSGGFQLVDRRSGLEDLFEAGKEIVVFDDLNDLRSKITFYLNNPEEREMIIQRGRQRVLREHTYENRMNNMLEIIGKGLKQPLWTNEGEDVESLVKESGEGSDLGKYLSRFSERGKISLSDIAEEISNGEGDISKTEGLLLIMNEFVK
ncbi:MAG: glycosyltransferase [Nitrospirae bacterium]|nr:glycosyltransferase [Nitrospirota bacterium]